MRSNIRLETIIAQVEEKGFVSVKELSDLCQVNEMTIRRDLKWLEQQRKIRRTHGGAASLSPAPLADEEPAAREEMPLVDRIDVLVASAPISKYESILPDSQSKRFFPIVAESTPLDISETCVSVNNFEAGRALGRWAGEYARDHYQGQANVLDLTYHLSNTQERSQGFMAGVCDVLPNARLVLSVNTQSRFEVAYQLTRDALSVYKEINTIFAMNDTSAMGALQACHELDIDPQEVMVLPYGIEGDVTRNLIMANGYCKAGLAMFPEIVGPTCVEAAIAVWSKKAASPFYTTPFAVLTYETIPDFYSQNGSGWILRYDQVCDKLPMPVELYMRKAPPSRKLPQRIGFIYTFLEHEWYHSLIAATRAYTERLGIELEVIDAEQTLKDEIEWRRREIARSAAAEVHSGETIAMDSGAISIYLAELLRGSEKSFTVLTNSMQVMEIFKNTQEITLISTGGVLRRSSMSLVGPTAEATLHDIRVDKLFLNVNGVSLDFGLSHYNLSEVTIKQAMIRSAREVILLADHTCFGQESFIQVAPVTVVKKIIADDALPASVRLELSKLGIRVQLASA